MTKYVSMTKYVKPSDPDVAVPAQIDVSAARCVRVSHTRSWPEDADVLVVGGS